MEMTAYCKLDTLQEISKSNGFNFIDDNSLNKLRSQVDLIELFLDGVTVLTNSSKEEIEAAQHNPFIKALMRKGKIWPAKEKFDKISIGEGEDFFYDIKEPISFVLLDNITLKKSRKYEDYYGHHCLASDGHFSILFEEKIQSFKTDTFSDWQFAKDFLSPHNCIVIADPYLFKEATLHSLKELITFSVSRRLKKTYYITLIGSSNKERMDNETYLKNNIEKLRKELTASIPELTLQFEYYFCNQAEFHDRYIITNNTCIFSGYGLDIIKKNISKKDGTWLAFKPFKKISINGERGVFFYKAMKEKLMVLEGWIRKNRMLSSNPLLRT